MSNHIHNPMPVRRAPADTVRWAPGLYVLDGLFTVAPITSEEYFAMLATSIQIARMLSGEFGGAR